MITITKFHNCHAHVEHKDNGDELLVSYTTPVVAIRHTSNDDVYVSVSDDWRCSMTTIHQVSRFMREHGVSYYDVKAFVDAGKLTPGLNITNAYTSYDLGYIFRKGHSIR